MISVIDIIIVVLAIGLIISSISRGFLVSVLSLVRLFIIVPASYFLAEYITPFIELPKANAVPEKLFGIIVCVVCFFVLLILSGILLIVLKKLQKKKGMPLRHTNAFLGGVFGLVKTLILVVFASTVLGFAVQYISKDTTFYQVVDASYIVSLVNEYNPFLK